VSDRPIFLDYNATTPLDPRVAAVMQPFFGECFGNPSSRDHVFGWNAAKAVDEARELVAALVNASPREIVFTSGTTESINLAIHGIARSCDRIIVAATEHDAVLAVCRQQEGFIGIPVVTLGVNRAGQTDAEELRRALRSSSRALVAISLANAETGVVQPVAELMGIAHEHNAITFCDLAQAAGKLSIDVQTLGIDLAAFSAHKMHGPMGVGALFVRQREPALTLEPLIVGGGQEHGQRGGTLNVPGIVGFGAACRIARSECAAESRRIAALRDRLESAILKRISTTHVNGGREQRLTNTSNITFTGLDARALIRDMYDVAVSTRSACSTGAGQPSHVLKAMGLTDDDALASIRFSLGRFTTAAEIDAVIEKLVTSVARLRSA
jgi:cysteine desulfurase